jgi:hypothetical protein
MPTHNRGYDVFHSSQAIHEAIQTFTSVNDGVTVGFGCHIVVHGPSVTCSVPSFLQLTVLAKIRGIQRGVVWREFYSREEVLNAVSAIIDEERCVRVKLLGSGSPPWFCRNGVLLD